MKRKFLIITLCFTIIFSSLNIKRSYADGGIISVPMLATISSLAVASGIIIKNHDDIYDIGRIFYDYVSNSNELIWDSVVAAFNSAVVLNPNNFISVGTPFLDIVKGFFDTTFDDDVDLNIGNISSYNIPSSYRTSLNIKDAFEFVRFDNFIFYVSNSNGFVTIQFLDLDSKIIKLYGSQLSFGSSGYYDYTTFSGWDFLENGIRFHFTLSNGNKASYVRRFSNSVGDLSTFPYTGGYTWDNVESKKESNSVSLPIPNDLGQLVGQGSSDFWNNTDNLVGSLNPSLPSVDNPSISVDNSISFPNSNVGDTDIPTDKPTDKPSNGLDIFPPWGGGIDFTPVTQSSFTEKFPFSLASDIKSILDVFNVEPIAPKFEAPLFSETIVLDLTEFDTLASIVRFFILIGFILSLILITRRMIG